MNMKCEGWLEMELVDLAEAKPTKVCEDTAEYLVTGPGWEVPYCKSGTLCDSVGT